MPAVLFEPRTNMAEYLKFYDTSTMNIERLISKFDKDGELSEEINIDFIPIETLRKVFTPVADDINLICVYTIGKEEAEKLENLLEIKFDLSNYSYQLDCFKKACDEF